MGWQRKVLNGVLFWIGLWCGFEILFRLLGYGGFIVYVPDPELLWFPRPNQTGKTVAGHRRITINGQGLRYRADLAKRDSQEHRIVAFGDSVTMGWGVDDESHYCAVLERRLAEQSSIGNFRVISAGVNAYPTSLCVRRFKGMLARGYQIDTAILAYSFNRRFERLWRLDEEGRKQLMRRVRLKNLVRRSAVYNFVIEDWLRNAVYYRARNRLLAGSWDTARTTAANGQVDYRANRDVMREETERRTRTNAENDLADYRANLDIMREEAERRGIRVVFLLLVSNGQRGELSENQMAFLEYARQHDIPVVNMNDCFAPLNHDALFMDHVHPTEEGHRVIADSLLGVVLGSPLPQG